MLPIVHILGSIITTKFPLFSLNYLSFRYCHRSKNNINNEGVTIYFKNKDNSIIPLKAKVGTSILELSRQYDLGLEGACEGSVACSTCHIYVDPNSYNKLPLATDEEDDMLDMAPLLTEFSRLGCQVIVTRELDGMTISFPGMTRNFYVDGHKPSHH